MSRRQRAHRSESVSASLMQRPEKNAREEQWAARMREGDRAAFKALFRAYYDDLCDFVEAQVHSPEVAEDLIQEVFLDLWRRRGEVRVRETIKAYLYGAARNKAIKHLKHRQVRRRWERRERQKPSLPQHGPEEALRHRELEHAMQTCVAELPERRRMIYVLSRRHGLSYKEIAAAMGITRKTVENQMGRALRTLRRHLTSFLSVLV